MNPARRSALLALAATTLSIGLAAGAHAQAAFPDKPVKLIVPVSAGGAVDGTVRLLAERLQAAWKVPVIVDNRPGANGAIAASVVAKSPNDGYTVLLALSALVQTTVLVKTPTYALKDFTPVTKVAVLPVGLAVGKGVPAATLAEFIQWAKRNPTKVEFGSTGVGSSSHILGETLNRAAGINMLHVPFKGESPAVAALVGGQITAMFGAPGTLAQQAAAGNMKVLAVTMPQRLKDFPNVPTFTEAGFPMINRPGWLGVFVPVGTAKPIVDKLAADFARAATLPEVTTKIDGYGFVVETSTPAAFASFVDSETAVWGAAIKRAEITID